MSTTLLLDSSQTTGNSANFSVHYNPPIELDPAKQYEIGMISCTCWNAMANVKTGINDEFTIGRLIKKPSTDKVKPPEVKPPETDQPADKLKPLKETLYKYDLDASGKPILVKEETKYHYDDDPSLSTTIKIPQGAYNIEDLNKVMKELITKAGYEDVRFELAANYNTLRAKMTLKGNVLIDFTSPESIAPLLGFANTAYHAFDKVLTYEGEFPVNITDVNTILVNCSIASGSYTTRGSKGQTIYSFSPDVPPGTIMQINPRQVIYYSINLENQITSITMQLTDQSGRQIDLNNEIVTYYLHLRATTIL